MTLYPPESVTFVYDGTPLPSGDAKTGVEYADTKLNLAINAVAAPFEIHVRDPDLELTFKTGKEIRCFWGSTPIYGGYVTQISRTHHFPDKPSPKWILRGLDFNLIFDKRVLRNDPATDPQGSSDAYILRIPSKTFYPGNTKDGQVLRDLLQYYSDMSDWEHEIDDIGDVSSDHKPETKWGFVQQGSYIRTQFESLAGVAGAFFYAAPSGSSSKKIYYRAFEHLTSPWGFSDTPSGSMYPFREAEAIEQGDNFVNDAMIWGGSEYAASSDPDTPSGTFFKRVQDSGSIAEHGRWQRAELHIGENLYGDQEGVDARANAIVLGPPGTTGGDLRGLRYPQWMFNITWDSSRVPGYLVPGMLVPIDMNALGLSMILPLQGLEMTFPTLSGLPATAGKAYVRYRGSFSLQSTDPFSLWAYIMRAQYRTVRPYLGATVPGSKTTVFGAYASTAGGTNADVELVHLTGNEYKTPFGYIAGTLQVFYDGKLLSPYNKKTHLGDVEEVDNRHGKFKLHLTNVTDITHLYVNYRSQDT